MANLENVSTDDLIAELHKRSGKGDILGIKIWRKEDINCIESQDINCIEGNKFTDNEIKRIAEFMGEVDGLSDCTDDDWDTLRYAVEEACASLGIKIGK